MGMSIRLVPDLVAAQSGSHGLSTPSMWTAVPGLGVEANAHSRRNRVRHGKPTQPNLRQVHLLHRELLAELGGHKGFVIGPGGIGENLLDAWRRSA